MVIEILAMVFMRNVDRSQARRCGRCKELIHFIEDLRRARNLKSFLTETVHRWSQLGRELSWNIQSFKEAHAAVLVGQFIWIVRRTYRPLARVGP